MATYGGPTLVPTASTRMVDTALGCAGVLVALGLLLAVALLFPSSAERWMHSDLAILAFVGLPTAGFFLLFLFALRGRKGWIVCAADGLYSKLPGVSFPSFLAWNEIRDSTFVTWRGTASGSITATRGGSPRQELTISSATMLLDILRQRSARKRGAYMEQIQRELNLLLEQAKGTLPAS